MKNILYKITFSVILSSTLFSCTSIMDEYDLDENIPGQNENYLNPPTWIQGEWADIGLEGFPVLFERTYDYKFTTDDFLYRVIDEDASYKELLEIVQVSDEPVTIEEVINDSVYTLKITGPGANIHHDFRKTSDSTFYDKVAYENPIQTGTGIYFKRYRQ